MQVEDWHHIVYLQTGNMAVEVSELLQVGFEERHFPCRKLDDSTKHEISLSYLQGRGGASDNCNLIVCLEWWWKTSRLKPFSVWNAERVMRTIFKIKNKKKERETWGDLMELVVS